MTLALVTHDMGVIAALADDVAVMREGQVVERGTAARLLGHPDHEYTQSLLAATPRVDQPGASYESTPQLAPVASVSGLVVRHRLRRGWFGAARGFAAVDGVSLSVAPGEALGVVGESGCGKSTLTRALLRLLPASEGGIAWSGQRVENLAGEALRRLRADVQIVFQDPFASLDPSMSVSDIVAEPLRALRPALDAAGRRSLVTRALADVGLGAEFLTRRSPTLSGGQCQRVAIARAMVVEPKLLVCDEAVSALDVSVQSQVLDLLAGIKRERRTALVFVSHNLAVVRRLCERVAVMYLGRIVEEGPSDTVFRAPRHPYTRMLLEAVPLPDPAGARRQLAKLEVRGEPASPIDRPTGCEFRTRCPAALESCAARRPGPEAVDNSHRVACLRWRELAN
jgi:oligopeptide/dipeptide ABC transporter ATP-binding protein